MHNINHLTHCDKWWTLSKSTSSQLSGIWPLESIMEIISAVDEKTAFFVNLTLKSEVTLFPVVPMSMHSLMVSFT